MSVGHALPTGTVTMLFTDIEGSTRLVKQLGDGYGELLAEHRRLLREAFVACGGREMDSQGDAFFVAFPRARNAVEAAVSGPARARGAPMARRRRVPRADGSPHGRAVGGRRGLPRDRPASRRPNRRNRRAAGKSCSRARPRS